LSAGHWDVEICDAQFICAFNEIFVTGSDDLFTVNANPQYLEAAFPAIETLPKDACSRLALASGCLRLRFREHRLLES
jgi:hypothetical protein